MAFPPGTSCLSLFAWLWSPGGSFLMTLFFMDLLLIIPWCLARFRSLKRMARLQALLDPTAWAMDEYAAIFILWLRLRISSMDVELGAFFLIFKSVRMKLRANLILWELVFRVTPFGVMVGASKRNRRLKLKERMCVGRGGLGSGIQILVQLTLTIVTFWDEREREKHEH